MAEDTATQPPPTWSETTARDTQRQALADLISLLQEAARRETAILARHREQLEAADKELDRAKLHLDHVLQSHGADIEQKHAERLAVIQARHRSETASATEQHSTRQSKYKGDYAATERDLKKQLEQAVWLADSVNDGAQAKIKTDNRKAREAHEKDHESLDEIQNRMVEALLRFGFPPPTQPPAPTPFNETAGSPVEQFTALKDSAAAQLAALKSLSLPTLLVGVTPWLLAMVALAGFGFAGHSLLQMKENFVGQNAAIGVGTGLVLVTIIGIVLNIIAKRQVRQALAPLQQTLADARALADLKLTTTKESLAIASQKAAAQREVEVRAANDKIAPLLDRARQAYESAVNAIAAELSSKTRHADERRDKSLAELKRWHEKHLAELTERVQKERDTATARHTERRAQIEREHEEAQRQLKEFWETSLSSIRGTIDSPTGAIAQLVDWSEDELSRWSPPKQFPSTVRFGRLRIDAHQLLRQLPENVRFSMPLPKSFDLPAVLALPRQASLVIQADREGRLAAISTLQMLMARLLTSVPPGRVKFTIIDPVGLGQNFAGFMHLADYDESLVGTRIWTDAEHIEQRLADLTEHMETVIQKYLRNEFETIDQYNAQAGELAEPYRFLVISDFPHGFQGDSFRRLASIASTGARCGVHVLVFRDQRQNLAPGSGFDDVEAHSVNLVQDGAQFTWKDEVFKQFPLVLDLPPDEQMLTRLMHTVGRLAKDANRVEVPFETIAPKDGELWTLSARGELRVPIGRMGATRLQSLKLGRGVAQHALVAGKTGSGKSTLLHAIITNAAMWYSPDELELYLIDFKKGVEFKAYATANLPHARAIAVESDREFGLSVLQRIDAEMTRRGEMFRKLGVQDLAAYRDATRSDEATERRSDKGKADSNGGTPPPAASLPRILLIIDEFQEFFSEDDKLGQDAALLIDRLVRQGRAFGIHVFLGSQTIGGSSGLSRSTLGQMAVRIALQTTEADSQLILGDNNSAARLLTRPGEAIYNDAGGLVENNSPFQVAWLPDSQRDAFLERVNARLAASGRHYPAPIVFEGNAPADIARNQKLARLIARQDQPPAVPRAFLGDPVAIKDPTSVAFRRQAGANVLIIGQQEESALAMTMSSIVSLAAQLPKDRARFVILDGTPADSMLHGQLASLKQYLPHEIQTIEYRDVPEAMSALAAELKRRQESDDAAAPATFVIIFGLQRYRALRKSEDSFSFSSEDKGPQPDKQFAELLREGPALGVHVITWADTAVSVDRTIERSLMREFDHRILMQMSANDSSTLIDSPAANKLGFFRAIAFSEEQGVMEKFRPYALPGQAWLEQVRDALAG